MEPSQILQKIAMTGASGFLGASILKRLDEMPIVEEIHIFDIKPPSLPSDKIIFHRIDLASDRADAEMAKIMLKSDVSTFLHFALFSGPGRHSSSQREVESIGTFHVLNAVAEANIKKLIVHSATFVYGAHAQNPNFISEKSPLRPLGPSFVRTRVDVEKQIQEFSKDYSTTAVTVLRFAPIVGPNSNNILARYFLAGAIPKVMGYDPLLQFVHEDDAMKAFFLALFSNETGAFNIVGKGVLPLGTGIHMSGKIPFHIASPVCRTVFSLGYRLRLWDLPASMMPFFQFLCVADGRKAESVLKFQPRFSSRQALKSMIEAHRLRNIGFAMPSSALGEDAATMNDLGFERV